MSNFLVNESATPPAPGAGKKTIYTDIADGRLKYIDANGLVRTLTSVEWPKNHIINGGFNFAQRQVPVTLTTYSQVASRAFTADRWFASNENASLQFQQVDTITAPETNYKHRYYGKYKKITAGGKFLVGQVLSAENSAVLRGQRVRMQCWMRRTIAAAMSVRIGIAYLTAAGTHDVIPGWAAGVPSGNFVTAWGAVGTDPTLGANITSLAPVALSADGGAITGTGLTCALTGAWVRYSACFDIPSTAKNILYLIWTDGQPAANDELNVGQCILTEGVEITEWISNPQINELVRCQRFYQKTFPLLTAPAQNAGTATGPLRGILGKAAATALAAMIQWRLLVVMRGTPTVTLFNPAAANAQVRQITGTAADLTASAASNITDSSVDVTATGAAAGAVGDAFAIHLTADAEI